METSSKGNAFQNFAEYVTCQPCLSHSDLLKSSTSTQVFAHRPVSDENDPATVNYDRSEAVVDALITLEIIVVIAR